MRRIIILISYMFTSNLLSYAQKQLSDTIKERIIKGYTFSGQENIGKKMVNFSAVDLHGKKYTVNHLKDKITFINIWFEACPPCLAEYEALNDLYETYKGNKYFQFLSYTYETKGNANRVVKERNLKFPVLLISYNIGKTLNYGQGFPVSMIIDKRGKIKVISPGGPIDPKLAMEKFELLFKPTLDSLLHASN